MTEQTSRAPRAILPRPRPSLPAMVAAFLLAATGGALGQAGGGAPPPQAVSVVTAAPEAIPVVNELPGRIAPTRIAEVRPRISGIIQERVFTQGAQVQEGDVLYRIDSAPFEVQVDRAQAAVAQAEAARKRAEQASARQEELRERRVVSAQQFDDAAAELAQSTAAVAVAEAELRAAELDLHYAEVRAPISGRIGRARITEGALVSASGANLATIQQLDPVYADFTQSATELLALRKAFKAGELTQSDSGEVAVNLMFDDGSPYGEEGRLLFSESTVDETTGQVTLRAEFPNPDGDLLPGMYVRVQIEQGVEPQALQHEGQHGAGERAEGDDADKRCKDRCADQQPVLAIVIKPGLLPDRQTQEADGAKNAAERQARRDFPQQHPPPVGKLEFAESQRPDDERGCLRTGIAARRHDERNEQRQHHRLLQLTLEMLHGAGRQHFTEEQRCEPAGALADHVRKADRHIGPAQRFHTAELVGVFRCIGDHGVDHVVDGDDAENMRTVIDDGQRQKVVLADQPGDILLRHQWAGADDAFLRCD